MNLFCCCFSRTPPSAPPSPRAHEDMPAMRLTAERIDQLVNTQPIQPQAWSMREGNNQVLRRLSNENLMLDNTEDLIRTYSDSDLIVAGPSTPRSTNFDDLDEGQWANFDHPNVPAEENVIPVINISY